MATFEKIAFTEVGSGGQAEIDFTSIPSTFTDLTVLLCLRGTVSATNDDLLLKINNDSTSSRYTTRSLSGAGSGSGTSSVSGYTSFAYLGVCNAATSTSSTFSNHSIYIPNYTVANQRSYSVDSVQENNATTAYASLHAGLYNQTTTVSRLVFLTASGNFAQYSTATLYGIKKA